ncbi:MAG: hypothetical protein ACR2MB_03080, partial [Acidimicrobiales bacterium]
MGTDAVFYGAGARGRVESCTFRSIGGSSLKVVGGAKVSVRDLTATDVEKSVVLVESGSRVDVVGARMSGRLTTALLLEKDSQGDVSDLDVTGCVQAAIAVSGAKLTLARSTVRQASSNVLKVLEGGSCRASALLIESGEVDFPLVNIYPNSSVSIASSTIRGGAESAVHHAGSSLELTDVSFEGVGGHAVMAVGSTGTLERCTATDVGTGIEASSGCRLSVTATEVDGGENGVVARGGAI